ncbi:DinB family protein [Saccharopolyspora sp. HNM0986]|uniref:DinB family protein n=1 Tax=Saccharopolyspora galaxeae TaxID=2781241 RepID=UPI00190BB942|nr:DinB family protein [Saccharopolyspora sp. HNM0986]MBK0868731.1 DinB family protein [Saccharopolyspora sp. HNM0986]
MDKQAVHDDMERARVSSHRLLSAATDADLHKPSNGTRWNNRQLLFHMLLGYLIIRALVILVKVFDRLPSGAGRGFARALNAATTPFDLVNYAGAYLDGTVLNRKQMASRVDRVIAALHRRLDAETEADLACGTHYPTRWDPCFQEFMTLADVYRFPTQHFDFHRRQLTLDNAS